MILFRTYLFVLSYLSCYLKQNFTFYRLCLSDGKNLLYNGQGEKKQHFWLQKSMQTEFCGMEVFMSKIFASTSPEISEREIRNQNRARKIAADGMVLLENDGTLPLAKGGKIALFGNGARRTVKGGTGSGDVNSRTVVSVEQGLENAGYEVLTKKWIDAYDSKVQNAQNVYFSKVRERIQEKGINAILEIFGEPFTEPEIDAVSEADITDLDTDIAVYVIARNSGEGKDRTPTPGDFLLHENEEKSIALLAERFEKLVVVLNVGGVIDTRFLRSCEGINAVLHMSQAGNIGGDALADVLDGTVTPSGHLTDTWAEKYEDYPCAMTYSHMNGDIDDEYHREGIYVGYRYFDTFGVKPAYPFGYGQSYTTFCCTADSVKREKDRIVVQASVTNTGDVYSGREVVQVYVSAPKGKLEKPYQELKAYAKTKLLAPGEKETVTMEFPVASLASYDEGRASYILEPGIYYVRVGVNSRKTAVSAALLIEQEIVTEVLKNCLPIDCEMEEMTAEGAVPYTYAGEKEEKKTAEKNAIVIPADAISCTKAKYCDLNAEIPDPGVETKIRMDDVMSGQFTLDQLVGQLTVEEMADLCVGTSRGGLGSVSIVGAASSLVPGAAGDTSSKMIDDRNIRNMVLADGPAGLRLTPYFVTYADGNMIPGVGAAPMPGFELLAEGMPKPEIPEDARHYYQYSTAIPIATLLAQTWDEEAIEAAGDIVGEEMNEFGVTLWLAPGMNIHRNPLCGRNFEYYSEDPLVTGKCAAADTRGVQKHPGVGTTIKHFALNTQEDNRNHENGHVHERAAREIYLKGFEIAVKEAQPMSIMTSYNLVNGIHTANSYDLLTSIARQEWGFAGVVMTDWGTTGNMMNSIGDEKYKYGHSSPAECIRAGNDLIMPGSENDVNDIIASVGASDKGVPYPITKGDLQACAKHILYILSKSSCYDGAKAYEGEK